MQRPRQFMTDDVWQTILHKYVVPYRHTNSFSPPTFIGHKDSEPLIDRKFQSRLRDLADAASDMKIDIYSNGVLLPKWRDRGEDMFDFLEGLPNQSRYLMSYHPVNHDGSVNSYITAMEYLHRVLRLKATTGRYANIEFVTVSHRSKHVTEAMQEFWRSYWHDLPITVHCNTDITPWTGRIDEATCHFNGCPYSDFGHWFFGVTGNVIACCMDLEEEIVLGNVMVDEPAAMFAATEAFYVEQRRILAAKERHPRGVCSNCFGQERADLVQLGVPC